MPKKYAAYKVLLCVSETQSNAISTSDSSKKESIQMTIQTGLERTGNSDIRFSNNGILEIGRAIFFIQKYFRSCSGNNNA